MENSILNYTDLKGKVITQLVTLQALITGRGYKKKEVEIEELIRKLKEDQVNLVILGHFNRGKSTFINSLVGENLLPTSIIPLTSVITLIKYGEVFKADVYFKDKTRREIAVEEIVSYATESGNPRNEKNVERIEVSFPAPYLKEGIVIVDTPGFSSVHVDNSLITQRYLPEADVAMFLIGVDPPISQTEVEFLKQTKVFTSKIFILQNKIDQVDPAERQQSLEFSRHIIETQLGLENLKIYPISAKLALEGELRRDPEKVAASLLPDFEKDLEAFLLREKGGTVLLASINQGLKLLAEAKMALELEKTATQTPLADLKTKVETFNERIAAIQQEQKDMKDQIQGKVERLLKGLKPEPPKPEQISFVKEAFQACYEAHQNEDRKTLVQNLEACFKQSVQEAIKIWLLPENERIQKEFEEAAIRFRSRIQELAEQIQQLSADLFHLQIENPPFLDSQRFDNRWLHKTDIEHPPLLKPSSVYHLLPKKYLQGVMWQEMLKKVEGELARNAEELCQEFTEYIQHRARDLTETLIQQIDATVENVQSALKRTLEEKAKSQKKITQAVKDLEEKLAQIQRVKKTLLDLQGAIRP